MDAASVVLKKLREQVLENDGDVPLALLLELLVPVERLRELAHEFGVTPKGGFRIERAPAKVLAPKLAEERDGKRLEQVLRTIAEPPTQKDAPPPMDEQAQRQQAESLREARALLALRDQEVQRLRSELERSREGQSRAQERERELERQLGAVRDELTRAQRTAEEARRAADAPTPTPRDDKQLQHRLRELEGEREALLAADEAMRRQLARDRSRQRELEDEVAELESLIPASRRRKKKPLPPEPPQERRFLVPYLQPSFYKSLDGKERRSVERAWQALLLFCTEGHGYPGLEVKPMGGQDTWSLRASLGLRVYFRPRPDGDIDVLELGNREDQHTLLRRLKDR
jgi:hypothetical protein